SQATVFLTNSILSAGIFTLPRALTNAAETPDVWLSLLIGGCIIIGLVVVMVKLSQQFPGKTVFQYAASIAGRIPAMFPCLLLIGYFIVIAGFEIRVLGEVTMFFLLEGTPIWAILIPFIWVSGYLIIGGINAISR